MATARSHSLIPWNILTIPLTRVQPLNCFQCPLPLATLSWKGSVACTDKPKWPPQKPTVLEAHLFKNNQVFQVTPGFVNWGWEGPGDSGVLWIASPYSI